MPALPVNRGADQAAGLTLRELPQGSDLIISDRQASIIFGRFADQGPGHALLDFQRNPADQFLVGGCGSAFVESAPRLRLQGPPLGGGRTRLSPGPGRHFLGAIRTGRSRDGSMRTPVLDRGNCCLDRPF